MPRCNKNPWQPHMRRSRKPKIQPLGIADGLRMLIGRIMNSNIADAERLHHLGGELITRKKEALTSLRRLDRTTEAFIALLRESRPTMAWMLDLPAGDEAIDNPQAFDVISRQVRNAVTSRLPPNLIGMVQRGNYTCPVCGHAHFAATHTIGKAPQ